MVACAANVASSTVLDSGSGCSALCATARAQGVRCGQWRRGSDVATRLAAGRHWPLLALFDSDRLYAQLACDTMLHLGN